MAGKYKIAASIKQYTKLNHLNRNQIHNMKQKVHEYDRLKPSG